MPHAELPSGAVGWLVFLAVGFVGAVAGFAFLTLLNRMGLK